MERTRSPRWSCADSHTRWAIDTGYMTGDCSANPTSSLQAGGRSSLCMGASGTGTRADGDGPYRARVGRSGQRSSRPIPNETGKFDAVFAAMGGACSWFGSARRNRPSERTWPSESASSWKHDWVWFRHAAESLTPPDPIRVGRTRCFPVASGRGRLNQSQITLILPLSHANSIVVRNPLHAFPCHLLDSGREGTGLRLGRCPAGGVAARQMNEGSDRGR